MRVALGQLASGHDVGANLAAIDAFAGAAAEGEAQLLVLPEYATYDKKVLDASFPQVAEPLDGPSVGAISALAREHAGIIAMGMCERDGDAFFRVGIVRKSPSRQIEFLARHRPN